MEDIIDKYLELRSFVRIMESEIAMNTRVRKVVRLLIYEC